MTPDQREFHTSEIIRLAEFSKELFRNEQISESDSKFVHLEGKSNLFYISKEERDSHQGLTVQLDLEQITNIKLYIAYKNESRISEKAWYDQLRAFTSPVYSFSKHDEKGQSVFTPSGTVPNEYLVDTNGLLFRFQTKYFFNTLGQRTKVCTAESSGEREHTRGALEDLQYGGYNMNAIKQLTVPLKEFCEFLPWNASDYEIGYYVGAIQRGEFVRGSFNDEEA